MQAAKWRQFSLGTSQFILREVHFEIRPVKFLPGRPPLYKVEVRFGGGKVAAAVERRQDIQRRQRH